MEKEQREFDVLKHEAKNVAPRYPLFGNDIRDIPYGNSAARFTQLSRINAAHNAGQINEQQYQIMIKFALGIINE